MAFLQSVDLIHRIGKGADTRIVSSSLTHVSTMLAYSCLINRRGCKGVKRFWPQETGSESIEMLLITLAVVYMCCVYDRENPPT